jgi:DNA-binding MarR family transcriptional regulator
MGKPDKLRPAERQAHELAALIARTRRLIWSLAARRLEERGESMLVWQLLNRLRLQGPMTQCELAFSTGQHPAGVSRLLFQLESQQMVRRTRDPEDRRKLNVELTDKAFEQLGSTAPQLAAAAEHVLAPLSAAERRELKGLLEKLLAGQEKPASSRGRAATG